MKAQTHIRTNSSRPAGWRLLSLASALAALAVAPTSTLAQTAAPEKTDTGKEVVTLPTFTITETPANAYVSKQALSASRVAMAIQDIPQTVSVVTSELIQDNFGQRMIDVAKYVTPIVESTIAYGDRYQIRGFQVSHEFVDGMEISGADGYSNSLASYNIERIEIIKGPNAILVPGGTAGGQVNPITKSPIMKDQQSVTLELAQYFGNSISADINRILSKEKGIAGRVVAAYFDSTGYQRHNFRKGFMFAPSLSWQLSPANKFTVKYEFMDVKQEAGMNLPMDPSIGSTGYAILARGLPRDWSFADNVGGDVLHRTTNRLTAELLSELGDHVSSRLQVTANHVARIDQGGSSAAVSGAGGGSRNPFTGNYEPGVNWNTTAYNNDTTGTVVLAGTSVPVTDPATWIFTRANGSDHLWYNELHLRNDYAIKFEGAGWKSTTIAGVAANAVKTRWKSYVAVTRPPVPNNNLASISNPPYVFAPPSPYIPGVSASAGENKTAKQFDGNFFVYENLNLLQDRLLFYAGVSRYVGTLDRVDNTGVANSGVAGTPLTYIPYPSYNLSDTAKSYGVTVKVIKEVSLFYGYNSSGGTMPGSLTAGRLSNGPSFAPQSGNQNEFGVKTSLLNDTLTASWSHFDIKQANYPVPNSEYYVLVAQGNQAAANALQNPLYLSLASKGWEFEGSYAPNKNLTVIGNISKYKTRQPTGVRVRGVPDNLWGLYVDYRFTEGALRGFGVNVGADYRSDTVGQNVTAYTTTRPLPGGGFVPQQPDFKVAGRTLISLGFSYRAKTWTARVQISNVTDKDFISAGGSRTAIVPSDPRNLRGSITYNF